MKLDKKTLEIASKVLMGATLAVSAGSAIVGQMLQKINIEEAVKKIADEQK